MKAYDFEYDGLTLSDLGFMICDFNSGGMETVSSGAQITFSLSPTFHGQKHELNAAKYDSCLEVTFQICKNPCKYNEIEVTEDEQRYITSWLKRKEFHKFKLLVDGYYDVYFEGSFYDINYIRINGKVCGFELTLTTNRPFGLHEPIITKINNTVANGKHIINNLSDEEGDIYPLVKITIGKTGGVLTIKNALNNSQIQIINCEPNEVITMDYPVIETSVPAHKIQNDYNWEFFRLSSSFMNKRNELTISLPCVITITYSPVVRLGI